MQQGSNYAETLDIPFVIFQQRRRLPRTRPHRPAHPHRAATRLDAFPTPAELWQRYCPGRDRRPEKRVTVEGPYYDDGSGKPRATTRSTPSTAPSRPSPAASSASCWSWRPAPARPTPPSRSSGGCGSRAKKRILFLADRNILGRPDPDQRLQALRPGDDQDHNRQVDKSFEIYLSLYQAVTGNEERRTSTSSSRPDFFDLIVIDECHRGSAAEDSAWREILDYFAGATQIGLTATPKETKDVSNIHYFGEPVYTYSLRQGIDDGFLAPYKVVRIDFDKDLQGWRPRRADRQAWQADRRPHLQPEGLRPHPGAGEAHRTGGQKITEFLKKPPTPSPRPSSSARTSTTPSACARRW
jgi:type I restriction enzyme R subunit